jgi:hypothetical protein
MTEESDHDILIEVRSDVKHLIEKHEELKTEFHTECLPRIGKLEETKNQLIGRDGVIAIVVSVALSIAAIWAAIKTNILG